MSVLRAILSGIVAVFPGCGKTPEYSTPTMSAEELMSKYRDAPIVESVKLVARSLREQTVFLATDHEGGPFPEDNDYATIPFLGGLDKDGNQWAYAYTSEAELLRVFPQGSPYIETKFVMFFEGISREGEYRGLLLNSGSDCSYPIPRELFDVVENALGKSSGD